METKAELRQKIEDLEKKVEEMSGENVNEKLEEQLRWHKERLNHRRC